MVHRNNGETYGVAGHSDIWKTLVLDGIKLPHDAVVHLFVSFRLYDLDLIKRTGKKGNDKN